MILVNEQEAWPRKLINRSKEQSHDITLAVNKGDTICFVVKRNGEKPAEKVIWDPVITYVDTPQETTSELPSEPIRRVIRFAG